jgi:hypothetical protein
MLFRQPGLVYFTLTIQGTAKKTAVGRARLGNPRDKYRGLPVEAWASRPRKAEKSVPEMPNSGENHRQTEPVGGFNDLRIAQRASRLDDGRGPGFRNFFDAVGEGKERVGGGNGALGW